MATGTSLTLDDLQLIRSTLPDGAERVQVPGHAVSFDAGRGLWFCDIQVRGAPEESYSPFLRLALARYQPKSILGAELSPVVLADFVRCRRREPSRSLPRPRPTSSIFEWKAPAPARVWYRPGLT